MQRLFIKLLTMHLEKFPMSHPALQKICMTIHLYIKGVPLLYNVLDKYGIYQFANFQYVLRNDMLKERNQLWRVLYYNLHICFQMAVQVEPYP